MVSVMNNTSTYKELEEKIRALERNLRFNQENIVSLLNAFTESAFIIDLDGTFVEMNEVTAQRLGHSVDQLIGKVSFDYIPQKIAASRKKMFDRVVRSGRSIRIKDQRDGLILDSNMCPIFDEEGQVVRIAVFASDITERVHIEQSLQESRVQYQRVVENIIDGIVIASKNGVIQFVNPAFCDIYQYTEEEVVGMHASQLITPAYHHELNRFLKELEKKGSFAGETIDVRKDGTTFHVEIKGARIQFKGQDCLLSVVRNITARKRVEKTIREREKLYLSLFEKNQSMILLIDSESKRIIDANPAACSYYGYSRKRLRKMKISDINVLPIKSICKELQLAKTKKENYFKFQHQLANGDIRDVEIFTGPIKYRNRTLLCSIIHDITERKELENERERLIQELQTAFDEVKTLRGILPICASCKKIRDDKGYWNQIESYIDRHSEATFSHGICPDCIKVHYPDIASDLLDDE